MSTRIERAIKYYKKKGFVKTVSKTCWVLKNSIKQDNSMKYLMASKQQMKQWSQVEFEYQPKLSILIPMYRTPIMFFKELMECFREQIYENWELCLADGSGEDTEAYQYVMELQKKDKRIKYKRLESNGGISENTNAALDMATGDFIVLCDHDDLVTKDAFFHVVKALNENPNVDTLYTDEDKVDMKGKKHFEPSFKPDYNIDFLRSGNYICHMFVTRREIAQQVRFYKEYDGAQDFDFIFRCCEASRYIYHIPRILYHWRCHINSTAGNPESKLYAYKAGTKALQANLDRCGIEATSEMTEYLGYYFVNYRQVGAPKVSIISTEELKESVYQRIGYQNLEVVLISGKYTPAEINRAVREHATGEILFFLDPRIQGLEDGCFERLLAPLQRVDLASVFAKVVTTDHWLYSVGILTGINQFIGRSFYRIEDDNNGYAMRLFVPQDLSASDLSCVMIKRKDFDSVGGLDESLCYICSAVDLYLKLGEQKKLHLFETRAKAVIKAKLNEENQWDDLGGISVVDEERFCKKWSDILENSDRNYNPNFNQRFGGYQLKTGSDFRTEREDA